MGSMPRDVIACATCGAEQALPAPLYCRFCGARRAGGADPSFRTDAERYELVAKEPAYAGAMKHAPRLGWGDVLRQLGMAVAAVAISIAGVFVATLVKAGTLFTVAFVAIGAIVALAGIYGIGLAIARMVAPTRRRVAVLIADRLVGAGVRKARFRFADGTEVDTDADEALMGLLVAGDIGVAYMQRDRLVDYRWFDVMPPKDAPGGAHVAPSCPACAAPVTFDSRETCAFCRAPLPEPNLGEHAAALHDAREAAAKAPQTPARDPRDPVIGPLVTFLIGALGLFVAVRFQVAWMVVGESWPWIWIFVAVFVPITLVGAIWLWRRIGPRPPPSRALARVLRRRKQAYAEVNGRPVYRHYVTLVAENGARVELRAADEERWKALQPDDVLVVWERAGRLVDVSRLPAR
jgi:hypothetical protein